jgi:hypothetical protein
MKYSPLVYAWLCANQRSAFPLESDVEFSSEVRPDYCWTAVSIEQHVHWWNTLRFAVVAMLDKKLEGEPPHVCLSLLRTLQNLLSTVVTLWDEYRKARSHYEDGGAAGGDYPVLKESVDFWRKYWFNKSVQVAQFFVSEFCSYGMQLLPVASAAVPCGLIADSASSEAMPQQ